jgi:O-antigen biosynthesis protein WbqP
MWIRTFDIIFSFLGVLLLWPLGILLYVVGLFDTGSPIFKQERVGRYQKPFKLYKFRTMKVNTKSVATHLTSQSSVTKFGFFLRKTKLDELPQLINVLLGSMSLVGPRPCLFSQEELIQEREERGVFLYLPGITGLAQVSRIDMSTPVKLAKVDAEMLKKMSLKYYFKFIFTTIFGGGQGDNIVLNN